MDSRANKEKKGMPFNGQRVSGRVSNYHFFVVGCYKTAVGE